MKVAMMFLENILAMRFGGEDKLEWEKRVYEGEIEFGLRAVKVSEELL